MTTTLETDLEVFAGAVRRELHDLGPDVIDELTDGLEADLTDSLADGGSLGDPVLYAAELRAAAGLDPRGRRTRRPSDLDAAARAAIAELRSEAAGFVAKHPVVRGVVEFFVSLRPVWWVLRAWAFFGLVFSGVPNTAFEWMLFAGITLFSVQWGRGRWLPWRISRPAVIVLSVVALLALPVVAANTVYIASQQEEQYMEPTYSSEGITVDGKEVTNIFAYGADGEPLTGVQLFDQGGRRLSVVPDSRATQSVWDNNTGEETILVPSSGVTTGSGWNVYPLESVPSDAVNPDSGLVTVWAKPSPVEAPFRSVQQLLGYEAPAVDTAAPEAPAGTN